MKIVSIANVLSLHRCISQVRLQASELQAADLLVILSCVKTVSEVHKSPASLRFLM